MQPVITIFCSFTRGWAVDRWLDNLKNLEHDPSLTNLVFIIDIDESEIFGKLSAFAQLHGYRKWFIHMNTDWEPNEVRIAVRRKRIADIKNQSKEYISQCDGDIVVSLEDDTVFADLDLQRLVVPLREELVGFVEGVQCGRWGAKIIGAWNLGPIDNPTFANTILPKAITEGAYEEITAGGWYGYATTRELYLNCEYAWDNEPWGPDVNFGLWLRRQGYRCLIDWRSKLGHDDHGAVGWPDEHLVKVSYNKDPANGEWRRSDEAASNS